MFCDYGNLSASNHDRPEILDIVGGAAVVQVMPFHPADRRVQHDLIFASCNPPFLFCAGFEKVTTAAGLPLAHPGAPVAGQWENNSTKSLKLKTKSRKNRFPWGKTED